MHARNPLPGFGAQGLHADWKRRGADDPYAVVTAIWMIDSFTRENGATRVVPGSHRWRHPLPKEKLQPHARVPGEVTVTGRGGSVLVMNGHLLHSGTANASDRTRRSIQQIMVAREGRDRYGTLATSAGLPPLLRRLMERDRRG